MIPMLLNFLVGLGLKAWPYVLSYLEADALQIAFDTLDEGVETALEDAEAKAKATANPADDRRIAILRKYFEGWKSFTSKG